MPNRLTSKSYFDCLYNELSASTRSTSFLNRIKLHECTCEMCVSKAYVCVDNHASCVGARGDKVETMALA